jgi:hypothetical protein
MKIQYLVFALAALLCGGGSAYAENVMIGGTYDCSGSKRIVESCGEEYCEVQVLNPYAPDGKGAHIQIYRSSIATQFAQCSVSGGEALDVSPPARASANSTRPAAGGTPAVGHGDYRVGYGAGVRFAAEGGQPAAAKRLVANSYHCTAFIGTPPNGHLATMPGFTILGNGGYRHQDGSVGSVSSAGGTLEFHGGSLDGQAATFDGGATGRGTVHLYNQSRSRTVIDCDGG